MNCEMEVVGAQQFPVLTSLGLVILPRSRLGFPLLSCRTRTDLETICRVAHIQPAAGTTAPLSHHSYSLVFYDHFFPLKLRM